jgi:hypothetical protein
MAHPDIDNLMNAILPFAQQMLAKHGEFYPYGSTMTIDGQIVSKGAYDGDDHPPSQRLIDLMTLAFRQQAAAGQIRAAGICYDVCTIPPGQAEKTDTICIGLEHQSGQRVSVFLPYKKDKIGKIQLGELFATRRDAEFFIQGSAA